MATIFRGQSKLRIQRNAGVDITGATLLLIQFIRPDKSTGQWISASLDDETGKIYYDLVGGELNMSGKWRTWAYVAFSDGRTAPGEVVIIDVKEKGEQ